MPLFKPRRSPLTISQAYIGFTPGSTSIETADTYTLPAGTLGANGDAVEIEWMLDQTLANNATITLEIPQGTGLLADTRNAVCDRSVIVRLERVNATTVRKHMRYLYGTGTWYNPATTTSGITDATAAIICRYQLTNAVSASTSTLISRRVTFYPAVS